MRCLEMLLCCLVIIAVAPVYGQVEFLHQNWTPEVRQSYYSLSQGSRMMPYDWFVVLEEADSEESFARKQLVELGYLPHEDGVNNPDKLPLGFVLDVNPINQARHIGLNCAACHTNQITYNGKTFQIDGGPALSDMFGMISGVDESLKATLSDPEKFDRFKAKVLGLKSSSRRAVRQLKRELTQFQFEWSEFTEDSRTEHPWGRSRLDAFGMIFNRVASIDLDDPENSRKPDAPVSYPFLWGTSFQNQVQWNGAVPNENDIERLGRNVGEVLGVFGCLLYTSPSPRDRQKTRMPSSA